MRRSIPLAWTYGQRSGHRRVGGYIEHTRHLRRWQRRAWRRVASPRADGGHGSSRRQVEHGRRQYSHSMPGMRQARRVWSMAVGQQLQCRVCQTVFFAPVLATDQLPPTTTSESFSVERPGTAPASPAGRPAATDGQVPASLSETRPVERVAASRSWRTDGMELESPAVTVPRFEPQRDTGPAAGCIRGAARAGRASRRAAGESGRSSPWWRA